MGEGAGEAERGGEGERGGGGGKERERGEKCVSVNLFLGSPLCILA